MTTADKRKILHDFVDSANDQKVKAIYSKIETYIIGNSEGAEPLSKTEKVAAMKHASSDPLFLADMKEVNNDFDIWADEEFVAEIKSRIDDFENGKDKGVSWEDVKRKARETYNARHTS